MRKRPVDKLEKKPNSRDGPLAMIHRARFQNFKALKDVEITFDSRLTVLVGPNGSGKSSVLKGIYWLCQMAGEEQDFNQAVQTAIGLLNSTYSGQTQDQFFEITELGGTGTVGMRFQIHPTDSKRFAVMKDGHQAQQQWRCDILFAGREEHRVLRPNPHIHQPYTKQPPGATFIPAELIQLDAGRLAAPTLTTVSPPLMGADGKGLASLMAYFKLYDERRYDQVVELFLKVIRQVQRIRIDRVPVGTSGTIEGSQQNVPADQRKAMGEGLVFDLPGRKGTPASAMSDGTLYALGLIVKILDPQRPKTLLIDDIDHGFHPKAQITLVELLHRLLDEIPDLQIIATSHSPYILDRLKWNEVRVTSLKDDGSAVIARLEDHPDFDRWKDSMSPGEFWSTFYEEWATKAKPALQPVP